MTQAEIRQIKEEISRLEDLQIEIGLSKKADYALKNHNKLKKLRKLLEENNAQ